MGILICRLNGTGKSTLGRLLADRLEYEFIDNEDLFFPKADPSYTFSNPRSKEEAIQLLEEKICRAVFCQADYNPFDCPYLSASYRTYATGFGTSR